VRATGRRPPGDPSPARGKPHLRRLVCGLRGAPLRHPARISAPSMRFPASLCARLRTGHRSAVFQSLALASREEGRYQRRVQSRQVRGLLRPRTIASGASLAKVGKSCRSAEIRGSSRSCRIPQTSRGDAISRAVEQFADAAALWPADRMCRRPVRWVVFHSHQATDQRSM
jgi:hypothetical protein